MFTPSQLEQIPIELERLFLEFQQRAMSDIIRRIRINDEITRSADWQIYRLVQMGQSSEYIQQEIKRLLMLTDKEVDNLYEKVIEAGYSHDEKLYKAVGAELIPFKDNAELQQLIKAVSVQTKQQLVNITQTLGFATQINNVRVFTPMAQYLQRTLDAAVLDVTSGAFDYNSVLKRVVADMTKSGVRTVDYETGHYNRIEVAARRALMTGVQQVVNHINDSNARELNTDYFEVSWHATARPTHQVWQGRVYSRKELVEICGLGTGPGLLGWNCYHSYYPFIPGVSVRQWTNEQLDAMNAKENTPKEYNGKEYTTYEATQRQRQLETLMRAQRQKIKLLDKGGAAPYDLQTAQIKYQETMRQYKLFSKEMNLPQQLQRVYTDGVGKVISGKVPTIVKQRDISIHKSVGAAANNYNVRLPNGTYSKLVEGTKITKVYTFAGKGATKKIDVAQYLEKQYNVPASEWKKVRGDGFIIDENGKNRHAELHWFESDKTGRIKMKAKRYFDEG